ILSLCPSWFFQGLEDMKKIAIGEVFGKIISFFLILFLVNNKEQVYLVPVFYIVGQLFSFFLYFIFISKYLDYECIQIVSFKKVFLKLKKDWSMFVNILFPNFYNIYSYIILGFFGTLAHVAIYDISRKIMNISEQALGIISKVYFPILSRDISKFKEFLKVIVVSSLVLFFFQCLLTFFGLTYIFHENLDLARNLMYIQTVAPIIYGLMIAYGINLLGALGEDKALRNITIITSLIGFIMVTLLTYIYMAVGALLGVMFTWLVRFVLCYLNSKKIEMVRV
ncbi:oligosaccharide flippase family protein, partial [Acinetobacter baumannii]